MTDDDTDMGQYEIAYKDLIQRLGGSIDGVYKAAEHGSAAAQADMDVWTRVCETVDEVAYEHGVEGIWDLPAGYDPTQDGESDT